MLQTWVSTAMALVSGIGERAPHGPLKKNGMEFTSQNSGMESEKQNTKHKYDGVGD